MLSTYRDPFNTILGDVLDFDPLAGAGFMPQLTRGVNRSRQVGKMMNLEAFETENEFKVICEIPGVPKEKLDVNVDNQVLTIKCAKSEPIYGSSCNFVRNEIAYGSESRSIRLPVNFNTDPSCCCYRDGVLYITFPKQPGSECKKLNIEA